MGSTRPGPYGLYAPAVTDLVKPASNDYPAMLASIEGKIALVRSDVQGDIAVGGAVAQQALDKANTANTTAAAAKTTADGASSTATAASTAAANAVTTANAAKATADGIAATAQSAEDKADQAVETANDAKDIQLANAAAPDGQVAGYVTTPGTNTNTGVVQVISDEFPAQSQARMSAYQILATDHGVKTDGTDQTANLQTAINAAAAAGADLVLPSGTITANSGTTWKCHAHSIISTQRTILDFSGMTTGTAIRVDGATPAGLMAPPARITNVTMLGPTTAGTTVDGIVFKGHDLSTNSIYNVLLDGLNIKGFRYQEVFDQYTWDVHHHQCVIYNAVTAIGNILNAVQSGENITYSQCIIGNSPKGFVRTGTDTAGGFDVSFSQCSIDTLGTAVDTDTGNWSFTDCHIEFGGTDYSALGPQFKLRSSNNANRTPSLKIHGGLISPNGDQFTGAEYVLVETTTAAAQAINIKIDTDVDVKATNLPVFTMHKEVGNGGPQFNSPTKPIVNFDGLGASPVSVFQRARLSEHTNLTVNGGFENVSWATTDPSAGTGGAGVANWYVPTIWQQLLSADTSTKASGARSLKITAPSATPAGQVLTQALMVEQNRRYVVSLMVKTASWVTGSRQRITTSFYNSAGAKIGGSTVYGGLSSISGTSDWKLNSGTLWTPPGCTTLVIFPELIGCTGTMWLDDFWVCPT